MSEDQQYTMWRVDGKESSMDSFKPVGSNSIYRVSKAPIDGNKIEVIVVPDQDIKLMKTTASYKGRKKKHRK